MPHAHHFLDRLDRVTRLQTEFALELYRDEPAVRFVLDHVRLPPEAERVALSLDYADEGPFVIVTREGSFVTCLAKGMRTNLPVVPRGQLDALLAKVAEQRARREFAQRELRPDEEETDLFTRILSRGRRFAREDFRALSAFEALFGLETYGIMTDLAVEAIEIGSAMALGAHRVTKIRPDVAKALEKQDRITWAVAHLILFTGADERESRDEILNVIAGSISPTYVCAAQAGTTFVLRAAWAGARFGKALIPTYKRALASPRESFDVLDAVFGLAAIGLRHASAMAQVRRTLEEYASEEPAKLDIAAVRMSIAREVLNMLDAVEERIASSLAIGRDMCCILSQDLPPEHPLRFTAPEAVPEDLARTAILAFDTYVLEDPGLQIIMTALPLAARAQAEDFYFPRAVVRAWLGEWSPEETLDRMQRVGKAIPKREPLRTEKAPGRNEPCPCGSGKKWKRCHGAPP